MNGANDDDLDFEKELLDATSQSFLNQTGTLEESRIYNAPPSNNQNTSLVMPPVARPPPGPPKPAPLSFAE